MIPAEQLRYIRLIRESSPPLAPLSVELPAGWNALLLTKNRPALKQIRAVVFDLYGTLFVSGAGEISVGVINKEGDVSPSLQSPRHDSAAAPVFSATPSQGHAAVSGTFSAIKAMRGYFARAVQRRHEKARAVGIVWPEVRAEEIWAEYEGPVPGHWELPERGEDPLIRGRALSLCFELSVNPVYPMPGAESLLRALAKNAYVLGIISNAQFYTSLLFNAFFNASPAELGFDPELLIYSFEEQEAKPSPRLFARVRETLAKKNIAPEETLYIGNDMRNDILPASDAGFVTALFAGDRRSLRLREAESRADGRAGAKPDLVLDSLAALEKALIKTDN